MPYDGRVIATQSKVSNRAAAGVFLEHGMEEGKAKAMKVF